MNVVLCWHMHQPEYRDLHSGIYQFPWTYLHAIKDYVDMAAHLEAHPRARAVVNFAPVLLDQIADYTAQIEAYFNNGAALRDPVLAALAAASPPVDAALLAQCLRVNRRRVIERFPAYTRLATIVHALEHDPAAVIYAAPQLVSDLAVWYHLGWLAETQRRGDARVLRLQEKQQNYSADNRLELLQIVLELLRSIVPRYRALAQAGQVELALSPYAHPILPLLLEFGSARAAMPAVALPAAPAYPGGEERAHWHIQRGLETFERHFGLRPAGCWPSEGCLSPATLALLAGAGFRWTASGESVLRNSLGAATAEAAANRHRVFRSDGIAIDCFFRDDGLSDLIGFNYADWHSDDAVANLIHHLEEIAARCEHPDDAVVSIIMDGENAWEYYPENGYHFLHRLYQQLSAHPQLRLATFSEVLEQQPQRAPLPALVAGSWVYGTFSTWIGEPDKNRGWDMLVEAKLAYDEVLAGGALTAAQREAAALQLAVCEGSDWFWWFGDYNPAAAVSDFERLFRLHLANLYRCLGRAVPAALAAVISRGGGAPERGGVMLHGQAPG